jgi:hypothetical protein
MPLAGSPAGRVWFEVDDGQGEPSPWVTLRPMRVAQMVGGKGAGRTWPRSGLISKTNPHEPFDLSGKRENCRK